VDIATITGSFARTLTRDRFSPSEHLAGFLERGVRHDVTPVPGASARNLPAGEVALCCRLLRSTTFTLAKVRSSYLVARA
jgi:hypothetical protein